MDVRFVETLLAAVEEGSLAAAARRQGITAAAAAQRIGALEAALKVPLLVRDGRRMTATPDCEALLADLRQMVALKAGLAGRLAQEQLGGRLRLGAVSTALSDYGPTVVQQLEAEAPAVELALIPAASEAVLRQFEEGALDAALIVAPPFALPKTMQFDVLAKQPIGFVRPVGEGQANDVPFLVYSRTSWGGAACWRALTSQVSAPQVRCELDAVEIIAQMVEDGLGQAVLPRWQGLVKHHQDLQFVEIPDAFREVGLLTWRRDARRPLVRLLRKTVGVESA
ncbi:LysR substrate-binding domain-containing protein [uncultured Shimia sp.]|uniref:LysR substrate-binding domain-containing protein n=1 Tax=uncultured Shimia sp. TaxID=573152 RepID=UPI00262632F4|nr:LysR substrate-binding domain-containing protein [uncultured Shimia sp.]